MTITDQVVKNIVGKVIQSKDYRIEVISLINAEFLQFAVGFFKKTVNAKLNSKDITIDWYKNEFLNEALPSDDIAIYSGLNKKTIHNICRSSTKKIVIDASRKHFESLYNNIQELIKNDNEIDLTLTLKFKGVSVDLNVSESLVVINTLAVKRAAMRGGIWSAIGKRAEKYLMLALCGLFSVDPKYYNAGHFIKNKDAAFDREVDFYLRKNGEEYKCEVKLMGPGNPESADAIIARGSQVLVADTLSQQNKNQCDQLGVSWVACRDANGYRRFEEVLKRFGIPYTPHDGDLEEDLRRVLDAIA